MFLTDSNIIVYSFLPQYKYLRDLFLQDAVFISEISRVEVLGYHKLTAEEHSYFTDIFNLVPIIFPSQQIYDTAIDTAEHIIQNLGIVLFVLRQLLTNYLSILEI